MGQEDDNMVEETPNLSAITATTVNQHCRHHHQSTPLLPPLTNRVTTVSNVATSVLSGFANIDGSPLIFLERRWQ
ncbi:hypothetical protein QVD17_38006 [Tagetes erecta]|uniref:Uncharacterized protein n=1 Tax=Tagetes erecta TaxID=13708 RepID=A0AAD8JVR5_TARER|nr:hypothetical protein QVD17_38006 [Tagetes erecta]